MDDFGSDVTFDSAYFEPASQLDVGLEDYTLVQSPYSVADYTQFETPAPLSIVENTVFPAQGVAGNDATVFEPHDAYYFSWGAPNDPVGCDEFAYDVNGTPLVLNHSHDETSIPPAPKTDEIVDSLFEFYYDLGMYARQEDHTTLKCRVQPCNYVHISNDQDYFNHLRTSHPNLYICAQCNTPFTSQESLIRHASESGHASFTCDHQDCGKMFSRLDTYERHQKVHQEDAQRFPCKYCKKYRGLNGFKRNDHLTQHLRGYHHIGENEALKSRKEYSCTKQDCSEYRWQLGHAFTKRPDYVKHMKAVHDTSEFPCPEPGCERVGAKGYFRRGDLRTHLRKVHDITNAAIRNIGHH